MEFPGIPRNLFQEKSMRLVLSTVAVVVAAIGLLWTAQPASAQGAGGWGPCKDDVKKVCGDIKPGGGRIARCMHEKESQVSPACVEHMKDMRAKHREKAEACRDDRKKLCGDIKPGGGRIEACMKQHEAELSTKCRAEFPG
jgi:hypothetical protein